MRHLGKRVCCREDVEVVFWKEGAREEPRPPALQPVMRTDFMAIL
jgi:hypothetical protein